jgi:hypothetical protein
MKWFGHVWRADNDIIKKVLTETIQKKNTNRQTTNKVERCGRKSYQDAGKKYDY